MSIAAIVPIGDPRVSGYGNNLAVCLRSMVEFADVVILAQSRPAWDVIGQYTGDAKNVILISRPDNWFTNGYNGHTIDSNLSEAVGVAKELGITSALYMSSNWYIPTGSRDGLREQCESVKGWDYLYRGDQLGNRLFSASKRLPMIIEIASEYRYEFYGDKLAGSDIMVKRGDYSDNDYRMVIDVPFEITYEDMATKMNYKRCYADNLPKRNPVFSWDYWHKYFTDQLSRKYLSDLELDIFGKTIAYNTKPDYLSALFLQEAGYANN